MTYKMAKGVKITLTEKQENWLKKHFLHTKNAEIAQKLGISETAVHRFARALGLKKSRQYMVKCQRETADAAKRSHRLNGTYPPKGYKIPGSEKYQFKPGETCRDRIGAKREAERIRKSTYARKQTYKSERARAVWGFEQRTKMRVIRQPQAKIQLRYYLKKRGYIVDDVARIVYYTETTKRGKKIEAKRQPWYKFMPLDPVNDTGENPEKVNGNNATAEPGRKPRE